MDKNGDAVEMRHNECGLLLTIGNITQEAPNIFIGGITGRTCKLSVLMWWGGEAVITMGKAAHPYHERTLL
jgi:hypothetical protein